MADLRRVVAKRLVNAGITIFGIITLNFFIVHLTPYVVGVDPSILLTPRSATTAKGYQDINFHKFGLDQPVQLRYITYLRNMITGDWGYSYEMNIPVITEIGQFIPWTLLLTGISTVITIVLGVWVGSHAAYRRGKAFDLITTNMGIFFWGMPFFWLALLMKITFNDVSPFRLPWPNGLGLNWWPALPTDLYYDVTISGSSVWAWDFAHLLSATMHLIVPTLTVVIGTFLGISLVMRNALIDVMTEDYVTTARAKGLSHRQILKDHALPNGMPPMITLIALDIAFVLGGVYQVEVVFAYKGIGWLTIHAINGLDFPVIQFILVIGGVAVVICNLVADFILIRVDPRIKIA